MKELTLKLAHHQYSIFISSGLLKNEELIQKYISHKDICIVSNQTVANLYLNDLIKSLGKNKNVITALIGDGEKFKNLAAFESILDTMLKSRFGRDCVVVALGGGIVGDVAGFAASTFQRGVQCIQIPTTLLAQVDSSVGGKTGVNHPCGKNLIGSFWQPSAVLIDTNTLKTLPPRELASGFAEVIKYALINDFNFLENLENKENIEIKEIIAHCCQRKAEIVASDERENGARALLNLGHTFGHALETITKFTHFKHGECVAIGTMCALRLSELLGKITREEVERVEKIFKLYDLPTMIPSDLNVYDIYQLMWGDKKVKAGKLRLILQKRFCESAIYDCISEELIIQAINLSLEKNKFLPT